MKTHAEYRKCGRLTCGTCRNGPGHGPYLYGSRKEYVGRAIEYSLDPQKLRGVRIARNWTITYVAKTIGVSRSGYENWEKGRCLPHESVRGKLCKLFGLSLVELGFTEHRRTR